MRSRPRKHAAAIAAEALILNQIQVFSQSGRGEEMQYNLETLGDEKFQQLCQALLARVFPNTQCLPVGQRDGGRDAFLRERKPGKARTTTVFQVKYSRDPSTRDARDIIQETIRTEGKKIDKLIERGAAKYYLITNVSGTSYLDSGSVDKANQELSTAFGIEAHCWWRDDIERRIDAEPAIKWSYPEIIRATDLLQFLCNGSQSSEAERRVEALKAFMVFQYRFDEKLKFKQIDLQKGIADMFVDVPARLLIDEELKRSERWTRTVASWIEEDRSLSAEFLQIEEDYHRMHRSAPGALQLLANADFSRHFPLVVVEGAPGQGKSTITQFLCQIHRMILLGRSDLNKVEARHRPTNVRIPIRIDLRDYATWVMGLDPFSEQPGCPRSAETSAVLESFLAALVSRHTGRSFSVDDLAAVAKTSQLLIVLDGFDEVADVSTRNRIVSEVSDASARISEDALSAQIVITSRPAAFANSPGFSREEFQYLELSSLTPTVILEYSNKWLDGRETEPREKQDVIRVLQDKLQQPHVRDLARNPMQLAILLNLISVRGASLPDKRTALYDSYIDIFLNREADKSPVVRDHRAVLLKIHRYLAWLLQMEAESKGGGGNISEARLRSVLLQFLESQGHTTELVGALFRGVVERVFVLVSRVQGTFEFEVQPLREYFAARYLYDTAPYSPTGTVVTGTLPERFVGLAKNFYWLNVTRFFAGCYSSGELASLRYGLKQIEEDERFQSISHLPELIVTLLQDHVFSEQPLLSAEMTAWILKEPFLTLVLAKRNAFSNDSTLSVPTGRSRDILVAYLKQLIISNEPSDRVFTACRALTSNLGPSDLIDFWTTHELDFPNQERWLWAGQVMDVFERMSAQEFNAIYDRIPDIAYRALIVGRVDLLDATPSAWATVLRESLSRSLFLSHRTETPSSDVGYFTFALIRLFSVDPFELRREYKSDIPFWRYLFSRNSVSKSGDFDEAKFGRGGEAMLGGAGQPLISSVIGIFRTPMKSVWGGYELWSDLFRHCKAVWGTTPGLDARSIFAVHAYAIKPDSQMNSVPQSPIEVTAALRKSAQEPDSLLARLAALRQGNDPEYLFVLLAALSFMSIDAIIRNADEISSHLDDLSDDDWYKIAHTYQEIPFIRTERRKISRGKGTAKSEAPKSLRLIALIAARIDPEVVWTNVLQKLSSYRGEDEVIIDRAQFLLVSKLESAEVDWARMLEFIRLAYGNKKIPMFSFRHRHPGSAAVVPIAEARLICAGARSYPLDLVEAAEKVLAQEVGSSAVSLSRVSEEGRWFDQVT